MWGTIKMMGNNIDVTRNNVLIKANVSITSQNIMEIGIETHQAKEEAQSYKSRESETSRETRR